MVFRHGHEHSDLWSSVLDCTKAFVRKSMKILA